MQAERDHLRSHVAPVLEERMRERRHYFELVDLRVGVETDVTDSEEQRESLILKVCLAEIELCRPFFIAILGDRYGWVPSAKQLGRAGGQAGVGVAPDTSVTAFEIELGILQASPDQKRRSFVYVRDPLP